MEKVYLTMFKPRKYQEDLIARLERKDRSRFLCIWPRRSGKDICAFNIAVRQCLCNPGMIIYYIFPTYSQARKVIWDGMMTNGQRILDFAPDKFVESMNSSEMKIRFTNGSLLQMAGSDNYDTLMGTNPRGIIFSEYALQDPMAYQFLRPILVANGGWALFISTPRGKNHLWELYNIALNNPDDWYCSKLSVEQTSHIPLVEIEKEKAEGLISDDLIQQEYYCSFSLGVEGSYYSKYLDRMRVKGQIGIVPWESHFKVHTAWDLGVRDSTAIIFFQTIGQTVRIIDCYENTKQGLEHYIKIINQKGYTYGKHIAPHDIRVKEWGTGMTRLEKAKQLGISFTLAPDVSIEDGIESVRSSLGKIWIDQDKAAQLLKALESYRQEYDHKKKVYKSIPLHDWSSNFADSMRYLCISLPKTRDGLSPEELDRRYNEAMLGGNANLPSVFRDDLPRY